MRSSTRDRQRAIVNAHPAVASMLQCRAAIYGCSIGGLVYRAISAPPPQKLRFGLQHRLLQGLGIDQRVMTLGMLR